VARRTFEAAREAGIGEGALYAAARHNVRLAGNNVGARQGTGFPDQGRPESRDFAKAFDEAEVKFTASYETPTQTTIRWSCFHQLPWNGDNLTIYEPSQYVYGSKRRRRTARHRRRQVRVINSYSAVPSLEGTMTARTASSPASRRLNRPVKLVATRDQALRLRPIARRRGIRFKSREPRRQIDRAAP